MSQEPVTLTERQVFERFYQLLKAGSFPGHMVVDVAQMLIFCERVVAASDPGVMTPTPTAQPEATSAEQA